MHGPLSSVSVVMVVRDEVPSLALVASLSRQLEALFVDFEFIFVANDVGQAVALELKELIERVPDGLAVFLADHVHDDLARLVGIDHAVCDHVLFCTPTAEEIATLPAFERALAAGCDLVIGPDGEHGPRRLGRRVLFAGFRTLFRWTTGKVYEPRPADFRIMSRAAALYVSTRTDGEVLVRARTLGSGFPTATVDAPARPARRKSGRSVVRDMARGARLITTGSTMLLRASSYVAVTGGLLSGLYAIYVVMVFFLVPDVQPGWTTMSLQLSGMMLLFSIQFLLLAEHVIQIVSSNPSGNRRHIVVRELRSPLSRRSARLNVVDREGRFHLGAPAEFMAADPRVAE